ncbi:hypothetical protein KC363_g7122 [Hortaea werneckii]|uniref:peptidylprolyl isomerase n=1 Tax=Hortaea werneckii TaxID=91943 RepID=A0A3M7FDD7_HORWE|nr:hypothetical protein KC325_g6274 [Hortaea werneckii]KAI6988867.1 hypothetical protein KC359_g7516 [Hortaea werneckii]KAI7086459.1 hypothetical protein KC356_g5014 [Hortaea werneckii]KAI7142574.1 hypothetical protein KC344_g7076 [Hortaea werneckii]KAI7169974.1 hypothetical protein KC360_g7144 [Hortaea werneckii]
MANPHRPRVFLDINIGEEPAGRLTIELFADKTPKTCENFRQLCTAEHEGMTYAKAPFHRIIDEFMIQGGDIANGDGTGTASIYDGEFEDENMDWREMDSAGLVCSANRGKDTNGSQFFITLESCPHLNGKHTIFGRLVSGHGTLEKIARVDVDGNDKPYEPVLIARCGELEKRKKNTQPASKSMKQVDHADRGRRRKSNDSDHDMLDVPEPDTKHRHRRQSDNVVDEGLRGRPRQRSDSRSVSSQPLSTPSDAEGSQGDSHISKHKRKRSQSPSRHHETRTGDRDYERRRRRSLPNQYEDENRYRPSPRRDDYHRRKDDRYRPSRDRYRDDGRLGGDDGRLGGGASGDHEPPVKFKGRGIMKYREPGRL